ncbi:MAG: enoyl-CoA hydratase/isomerase family protein, partial [Selenomonas sp.]|nr:enoyl-CoA hydratase/isomerase family protein [Selenomonas sp.]
MDQHIKQSIQDGIAQIVMDRPASNNALDAQMFRDLIAAVEHCDADEAVKAIILTGAGKNFSAGGDIKEMATFEFISYELSMLTGQAALSLRKCSKPIIA